MRRALLVPALLALLVSLISLSVLSTILSGYPAQPRGKAPGDRAGDTGSEQEPSFPLFTVSPIPLQQYWRISSADYYTGRNWLRTTDDTILQEMPEFQVNNTEVYAVEVNTSQQEIFIPLASPDSTVANASWTPNHRFSLDPVANIYTATRLGQGPAATLLTYSVSWRNVEVEDSLVSLSPENLPEEISAKYLQTPNLPFEVEKLARDLEDPSYSVLDQVLADVQFLRTNFVYDLALVQYLEQRYNAGVYEGIKQGCDISNYVQRKTGICIDAATTLAMILRIQEIPARISIGFKPLGVAGGKLLFYSKTAHALTEVYLPPYGWVQFDATPPLESDPLVKASPFKKETPPGGTVIYQLSVVNRRGSVVDLELLVDSRQGWNVEAAPRTLRIEANQTADALLEVTVPDDVNFGEKDEIAITVASGDHSGISFSTLVIVQAKNTLSLPTAIALTEADDTVNRGDMFWTNGTVAAADEPIDGVAIYIFLTRSGKAEGLIVGKGYSKQGSFQIRNKAPSSMEMGDYKVVLISLGSTGYAPSKFSIVVKVRATTTIKFASEEEFLLGYGAIYGRLMWDNGTGFANAPISLKIASLTAPFKMWTLQNVTSSQGFYRIATSFEQSGLYQVEATFLGSEYVSGSSASHVAKLSRGQPTIQVSGGNVAVRGEVFNLTVKLQSEAIGVWGENISVTLDDQLLSTFETGVNGSYTWSYQVDFEEELGGHILNFALQKGNKSAAHQVFVKSRTKLNATVSTVAGGTFLVLTLSLSDDHNLPIKSAEVSVDNLRWSGKTGEYGNLSILLDNVKLLPENLVLAASFEPSTHYLSAKTEKEVTLGPVVSAPFLIPLVSPTAAVIAAVYSKRYLEKRRQRNLQIVELQAVPTSILTEETHPLTLSLPDLKAPFPDVWGVNDELRIEIRLEKDFFDDTLQPEAEIFVDGTPVASAKLSRRGEAQIRHVFSKKGSYKMWGVLRREPKSQLCSQLVELQIVDYREEIIRLYNRFLSELEEYNVEVRDEMTAQEIKSQVLELRQFNSEPVDNVTSCFEKAEYSSCSAVRRDYEKMYISLKELNLDVE